MPSFLVIVAGPHQMAVLFALYYMQERVGTFALQYGFFSPQQFELVRREVSATLSGRACTWAARVSCLW